MRARAKRRWSELRLTMDHYPQVNGVCMYLFMSSSAWPLAVWRWMFPPIAAFLFVFMLCRRNHNPVESCCVSRWPKNPPAYVQRHARGLAFMHALWDGPCRLLAAAVSYIVTMTLFLIWLPMPVNTVSSLLVPAAIIAPVLIVVQISQIHRNALWFCPICWKRNGGDDDDVIPEPDPVPVGTKELQPA